MIEVVYVVRHAFRTGFTVNALTGEYTASTRTPTGIPTDVPLTAKGVQQSLQLAQHLCQLDPPIDRVYSSPFYRCLQTLRPATDVLCGKGQERGRTIRIDHGLGEFFGQADFAHPSPPSLEVLNQHFQHLDQEYRSACHPTAKGESIAELHQRVRKALIHALHDLDNDPSAPKTLLICTHAATMIAIGRVLTGQMPEDLDEDDFQCYTASLSKFVRRFDQPNGGEVVGSWTCAVNAGTDFLSGGAERGWKFNGEESFVGFPPEGNAELDAPKL